MTLSQIKDAIKQGKRVCVGSEAYQVIRDSKDQYLIKCEFNDYCVGLTWSDGITLNAKESEFFINDRI